MGVIPYDPRPLEVWARTVYSKATWREFSGGILGYLVGAGTFGTTTWIIRNGALWSAAPFWAMGLLMLFGLVGALVGWQIAWWRNLMARVEVQRTLVFVAMEAHLRNRPVSMDEDIDDQSVLDT